MEKFDQNNLKKLYVPLKGSHKGQNGKLMIIAGSHLFHGPLLWALKVASRIVDIVFYSSIPENNELVQKLKSEINDFIAVPRDKIDNYIQEADAILIGSGLTRKEGREQGDDVTKDLVEGLLRRYPGKKWVLDAGALTEIEASILLNLKTMPILTPHTQEFESLFWANGGVEAIEEKAREYKCTILLKGDEDIVCSPEKCIKVEGGNPGMTKGGTGDVLAGLVASLYSKNEAFLAASCGSFINKKAGDELYKRVGSFFNASDLADEIPKVMNQLIIK